MIIPTKEKNLIYLIGEKTGRKYTFDINTCILYGVSGKALKNRPSEIKDIEIKSSLSCLLYAFLNENNYFLLNDWIKAFSILDKINSVNCTIEYHRSFLFAINEIIENLQNNLFTMKELLRECTNAQSFNLNEFIEDKKRNNFYLLLKDTRHTEQEKIEFYSYYKDNSFIRELAKNDIKKFRLSFNYFCELSYLPSRLFYYQDIIQSYFSLCSELNTPPEKKDFLSHFILLEKIKKKREEKKNLEALKINQRKELFFSNDKYITFIPITENEFLYEATRQNNCLYRCYLSEVINGNTNIVFIRDKRNLKKNLVTCEVRRGNIIQFLKSYNNCLDDKDIDLKNFKKEYQAHLDKIWE